MSDATNTAFTPEEVLSQERLEANGEADAVGRRHAAFFLALAEEADPELREGVRQWAWLERLEAEHDNLRAALSWSLNDEPEQALRLAAALARFWEIRAYFSEGSGWLEAGLRRSGRADAAIRARASTEAGTFAWCRGDHDRAIAFHREALTLYRGLGDERGVAFALIFWAAQELETGTASVRSVRRRTSRRRWRSAGSSGTSGSAPTPCTTSEEWRKFGATTSAVSLTVRKPSPITGRWATALRSPTP
jgi:hypothetical protein